MNARKISDELTEVLIEKGFTSPGMFHTNRKAWIEREKERHFSYFKNWREQKYIFETLRCMVPNLMVYCNWSEDKVNEFFEAFGLNERYALVPDNQFRCNYMVGIVADQVNLEVNEESNV